MSLSVWASSNYSPPSLGCEHQVIKREAACMELRQHCIIPRDHFDTDQTLRPLCRLRT